MSKQATICSCCFSESRDSPTVSLLSSTCLLPLTALCSLWEGGYSYASSPSQGLSAPELTTMAYPGSRQRPGLESIVSLWACMPCSLQPCFDAGFEQAGRQLWLLETQELDPLEKGRSVEQPATHPSLTQVGSGIHTPLVP